MTQMVHETADVCLFTSIFSLLPVVPRYSFSPSRLLICDLAGVAMLLLRVSF
jgi:hypothetical protein